ncbi:MAG: hypothetical protein ACOVO2_03765, partial [Emticicia sp.]|uniref:hypothetical protein n=1 Tax=Emticicia sp. TaxID=1930953 RepID=UPI003BA4CF4B
TNAIRVPYVPSGDTDGTKIVKFTQNSQKFIKTNREARKLYLQFNRTDMTSFEHLIEEDIKAIFDYCEGVNGIY